MKLWAIGLLVIVLNVLDSVTTALCFRQYPDKEYKGEANPLMRVIMRKNRILSEVVKHVVAVGLVVYMLMISDSILLALAIVLGLVVINNSFIFLSRKIFKRKVVSPLEKLRAFLHIPEKYSYLLILEVLGTVSLAIYYAIIMIWE